MPVSLVLWGIVGFMLGVVAFLAVPILVGPMLRANWRNKMAQPYFGLCMLAMERALLVRRKHSGWSLVSCSYDAEHEAEKATVGGEVVHFEDPFDFMTRLKKRPFGLAWESFPGILDPVAAEVGEMDDRATEQVGDELELEIGNGDGEDTIPETVVRNHVRLRGKESLVDLVHTLPLMSGGTSPKSPFKMREFVKKSQSGYSTRDIMGVMTWILAYGAGAGMVWFIVSQGGNVSRAVGTGVTLAIRGGAF